MTLRRAARLATVLALAACAPACGAAPSNGTGAPRVKPVTALRVTPDRVDGRRLLDADAARAIVAGAGPLQLLGADIASEGERVGAFVEIPEGECMLAFARGSQGITDVDLLSYEDAGDAFASDEAPDASATVVVCPPHPRRLYVVARVAAGSGILAVGVQSVPRAASEAVGKAMSARGKPGEERGRVESWPGLEAKLREHRLSVGSRWEEVRRAALPVDPRSSTRISVTVDAGRCLDVLATPADEIGNLELVAEGAGGRIVARGRERGRDRTLLLCSAVSTELSLAVRPHTAQGLVAIVIGRSAVGAEIELSQPTLLEDLTPMRELDAARVEQERALGGHGYAAAKTLGTGSAKVGERVTLPVELPRGCARLDVVAGKPLAGVIAELWDDKGAMLAESTGGKGAALFPCGVGGPARVDLEALTRPGPFALELRKDAAAPVGLVAHPVAAARLLARLNAGGEPVSAGAAAAAEIVSLDPTTRRSIPLKVPAESCVSVVAALDVGGTGVDLRLVDAASNESTLSRARFVTADRLCAGPNPKTGTAEIRLLAGKADALVLVRVTR